MINTKIIVVLTHNRVGKPFLSLLDSVLAWIISQICDEEKLVLMALFQENQILFRGSLLSPLEPVPVFFFQYEFISRFPESL